MRAFNTFSSMQVQEAAKHYHLLSGIEFVESAREKNHAFGIRSCNNSLPNNVVRRT